VEAGGRHGRVDEALDRTDAGGRERGVDARAASRSAGASVAVGVGERTMTYAQGNGVCENGV
jgi:hypothetical protein